MSLHGKLGKLGSRLVKEHLPRFIAWLDHVIACPKRLLMVVMPAAIAVHFCLPIVFTYDSGSFHKYLEVLDGVVPCRGPSGTSYAGRCFRSGCGVDARFSVFRWQEH